MHYKNTRFIKLLAKATKINAKKKTDKKETKRWKVKKEIMRI